MSWAVWSLGIVAAAVGGTAAGVSWGTAQGRAEQLAQADHQAVQQLTELLDGHKALIEQAGAASRAMRRAMAARAATDDRTTREIRDALAQTAPARAGCVFPADVMRLLATARDRAAQAAAGGVLGAVPGAAAAAASER